MRTQTASLMLLLTTGCVPLVANGLPGEGLTGSCHDDLELMGADFEISTAAVQSPPGHPELRCEVALPVVLHSPVFGVELIDADTGATGSLFGSCEMARSLVLTMDDVANAAGTAIVYRGAYACRTIADTGALSPHASGEAIDITAVEFENGTTADVLEDWDQNDSGDYLRNAAQRWHDRGLWNTLLTPDYDDAHVDHIHADMTPGADFLAATDPSLPELQLHEAHAH